MYTPKGTQYIKLLLYSVFNNIKSKLQKWSDRFPKCHNKRNYEIKRTSSSREKRP